jgi:hypothetical protein
MDPFLPLKNFLLRERPERGDPKTMDMNKLKVRFQLQCTVFYFLEIYVIVGKEATSCCLASFNDWTTVHFRLMSF